jgi:hypothetical protein
MEGLAFRVTATLGIVSALVMLAGMGVLTAFKSSAVGEALCIVGMTGFGIALVGAVVGTLVEVWRT